MARRKRLWSHAEGGKGWTVAVYEREPGGLIYARAYDPTLAGGRGGYRRRSLGHRDRDRAVEYGLEQAAKLRQGLAEVREARMTVARLFAAYEAYRTPRKVPSEQVEDRRRIALWTRVLGATKDPHRITRQEWEDFLEARAMGAIDSEGKPVPADQPRPVRARTVERDCLWLKWVCNWGATWQDRDGRRLLKENPVRGFKVPGEANIRRPLASDDRYEATRAKSDAILMEVRWGGHRRVQRSYLSEILDLANGTGRRISAICQLRYEDLCLTPTASAPHGAIRWPGETDKQAKEWVAPIDPTVRAALDRILRERPGIGPAYLFPSPKDPAVPITKNLAGHWLLAAERLAELPKLAGGIWHPYRRGWATRRKHLPLADVAQAGGWKSVATLVRCYQQPDPDTMLRVVLGGAALREREA
jgi:integrase